MHSVGFIDCRGLIALSTIEAEYVTTTEASKEMIWLQCFLEELGQTQEDLPLCSDSQSAIHLAKNSDFHSRTKHIQLMYLLIQFIFGGWPTTA